MSKYSKYWNGFFPSLEDSGPHAWSGYDSSTGGDVRIENDLYFLNHETTELNCNGDVFSVIEGDEIPSDINYPVHPKSLSVAPTPTPTQTQTPTQTPTPTQTHTPTPTKTPTQTRPFTPSTSSDLEPWISASNITFDYDNSEPNSSYLPENNKSFFTFTDLVINGNQMIADLFPDGLQNGETIQINC